MKHLLSSRIKKRFPDFTEKQVKAIGSLSYKGWGKLSKTFLEQITAPAPETGEVWSIIRALWETNDNLMQLLSQNYQFMEAVESFNFGKKETKLSYQTVEELYVSPAVKRQIWQTLQVVEEIEKITGSAPKRIFVEMAREKQDSNRTKSRKAQLIDLYKACKNEENDWIT